MNEREGGGKGGQGNKGLKWQEWRVRERKKWQERRVADEALWAISKHCCKILLEPLFQRRKKAGVNSMSTQGFYTLEYMKILFLSICILLLCSAR